MTEEVELPEGTITEIRDSYKYPGIPQTNANHEETTRKLTTTKYLQRVGHTLKCQPSTHQTLCWHNDLAKGGD